MCRLSAGTQGGGAYRVTVSWTNSRRSWWPWRISAGNAGWAAAVG